MWKGPMFYPHPPPSFFERNFWPFYYGIVLLIFIYSVVLFQSIGAWR